MRLTIKNNNQTAMVGISLDLDCICTILFFPPMTSFTPGARIFTELHLREERAGAGDLCCVVCIPISWVFQSLPGHLSGRPLSFLL